jgi:hypothetical protein
MGIVVVAQPLVEYEAFLSVVQHIYKLRQTRLVNTTEQANLQIRVRGVALDFVARLVVVVQQDDVFLVEIALELGEQLVVVRVALGKVKIVFVVQTGRGKKASAEEADAEDHEAVVPLVGQVPVGLVHELVEFGLHDHGQIEVLRVAEEVLVECEEARVNEAAEIAVEVVVRLEDLIGEQHEREVLERVEEIDLDHLLVVVAVRRLHVRQIVVLHQAHFFLEQKSDLQKVALPLVELDEMLDEMQLQIELELVDEREVARVHRHQIADQAQQTLRHQLLFYQLPRIAELVHAHTQRNNLPEFGTNRPMQLLHGLQQPAVSILAHRNQMRVFIKIHFQ